jgi:serine protease Do
MCIPALFIGALSRTKSTKLVFAEERVLAKLWIIRYAIFTATIKFIVYITSVTRMIRNNTTITTASSIISLTGATVLALLMAMMIIIITSLMPLQALAQSDTIGGGQATENNNSSTTTTPITNANTSSTISGEELTFKDLFARVNSSVVQITSSGILNFSSPMLPPDGDGTAIGSGFVIDREGHVATNNHVIANARNVSVAFSDGSVYTAKVIGSDPFSDSAVLELQNVSAEKLIPLPLGNSSNLAVGDEVAAIGSPFGLTGSMSTGVVSGLGRLIPSLAAPPGNNNNNNDTNNDDNDTIIDGGQAFSIPNIIQTDTAINPGNSGGPLLDLKGEVIGMNTAGLSESGASSGVGFAVPSDTLKVILPALIANGSYVHPWIGVSGTDVTPEIALELGLKEARGFLVIDIVMGSPANRAGIRGGDMPVDIGGAIAGLQGGQGPTSNLLELGGDIILGVDNQTVNKIDDLLSYIESNKKAGDTVTLMVLRDGEMMPIDLVLGARESPPPYRMG